MTVPCAKRRLPGHRRPPVPWRHRLHTLPRLLPRTLQRTLPPSLPPSLWREEDGSEALEVAFVLPVFLMFTWGLLQMSLFLYCYVAGTYGSRVAVRYATQHGAGSLTPCVASDLQAIVRSYASVLPAGNVVVTPTWATSTHAVGSTVTVQVSLSYSTTMAVSGFSSLAVTTTATGIILQ